MHEFDIPPEVLADGPIFSEWHRRFVHAYADLRHGNVDLHDIADRAYLIYPKYRARDPIEAARELRGRGGGW